MADLLVERRGLQEGIRSEEADDQESDDSSSDGSEEADDQDVYELDAVTVGNLETNVTAEMLEETFGQSGQVESVWMQRGCDHHGMLSGVVVFERAEVALAAQQEFDGVELCGAEMLVRMGVCKRKSCSDTEEDSGRDNPTEEEI